MGYQIVSANPLFSGNVNGPNNQSQPSNVLFNGNSGGTLSHRFTVNQNAVVIQAFNLSGGQTLTVNMFGFDGITNVTAPLTLNGKVVTLTSTNNALVLDMPGTYTVHLTGGGLGAFSCMIFETGMGYFSYGLSDFSAGT